MCTVENKESINKIIENRKGIMTSYKNFKEITPMNTPTEIKASIFHKNKKRKNFNQNDPRTNK